MVHLNEKVINWIPKVLQSFLNKSVSVVTLSVCFFLFQHVKDRFWNFLFYKFIFVFGVMNVQTMEEVVWWVGWFTVLGFFQLLTQLSKDRFEYVSKPV